MLLKWKFFLLFSLTISQSVISQIKFNNVDFGNVKESQFNHEVQIINSGTKNVLIKKINTSCGCTVINFQKEKTIPLKSVFPLKIEISTSSKIGNFSKSVQVYTDLRENPFSFILSGVVTPVVAPDLKNEIHKDKTAELFSPKCASCHVVPGKDKLGQQLYLSSCATCHGILREGRYSIPPLTKEVMNTKKVGDIYNNIIYGGKPHGVMPGFGEKAKGPLSRKQVSSLVEFLEGDIEAKVNTKMSLFYQGKQLYDQLCSACHGRDRVGTIGPSLRKKDLENYTREDIIKLLTDGKEGTIMPAFSNKKGGLLSEFQIKLITAYLKNQRN